MFSPVLAMVAVSFWPIGVSGATSACGSPLPVGDRVEHFADERLERVRARDEVRFTVHFGDDAALAAVEDAHADQAFVGGASRALRRLGEPALAEDGGGLRRGRRRPR